MAIKLVVVVMGEESGRGWGGLGAQFFTVLEGENKS